MEVHGNKAHQKASANYRALKATFVGGIIRGEQKNGLKIIAYTTFSKDDHKMLGGLVVSKKSHLLACEQKQNTRMDPQKLVPTRNGRGWSVKHRGERSRLALFICVC
jgi:hypothetical protein